MRKHLRRKFRAFMFMVWTKVGLCGVRGMARNADTHTRNKVGNRITHKVEKGMSQFIFTWADLTKRSEFSPEEMEFMRQTVREADRG